MDKKSLTLLLILFLALAVRVLGINQGLPFNNRIFYETEEPYTIKTALGFGSGDLNPHSFNKPSLFYYFLFIFYAAFFFVGKLLGSFHSAIDFAAYYFNNLSPFYLIARSVVALIGTASVYLIYLIGRDAYGHKTGLAAASFLAVCGAHVMYSRLAQVDIPQIFFVLLCIYSAVKIGSKGNLFSYVCAGLFAGMAASTKYYGGFVIIVPLMMHFLSGRRLDRRLLCLIIFCFLGFILFTPFALIDFKTFTRHLYFTQFWAQDKGLINEQLPPWGLVYLRDLFKIANLGFVLTLLSLGGILYAIFKHSKNDIVFVSFALLMYSYFSLSTIAWWSLRYLLPVMPILLLLGARLLVEAAAATDKRKFLLLAAIFLFSLQPLIYDIKSGYLLTHKSTTNLAKEWIESHMPERSKILMDIFYVPQLTLSDPALARFKDYWRINSNRTGENLREALAVSADTRGRLFGLKDKSITQNGNPYDVFFIDYDKSNSLSDYIKESQIKYVILSSWVEELNNSPYCSARKNQTNYFYDSVRKGATLIKEFRPNDINLPGTRLEIYEIR